MAGTSRTDLDPFRVVLGLVDNSDILVRLANAVGLRFDPSLMARDAGAHKTRIRVLLPRIVAAYEGLEDQSKLTVARAAARELCRVDPQSRGRMAEALAQVGWELRETDLVVTAPDVREMFFPKGSPWDAFVILRQVFAEANTKLTIVDAYCDGTIFKMLATRDLTSLGVRILCSRNADAVAAEAKVFMAQHSDITVEVRHTRDFHDRFVVVDGASCIHVGASIKDAGKTAFMVSRVEDPNNRDAILAAIDGSWNAAVPVS